MKKILGLALALSLLSILSALPAHAAGNPAAPAVAAAAPATAQPGCQPVLDLGKLASAKGEACSAAAPSQSKTPEPEFMTQPNRLRTCACSCGFPCTSDADCGGALGSCRAGITCC
jgi:hypothetical protein